MISPVLPGGQEGQPSASQKPKLPERNYRTAFFIALAAAVALAATLVAYWRHVQRTSRPAASQQAVAAEGSSATSESPTNTATVPAVPSAETPLVPLQLSPERLQSIGVKTAIVQFKNVNDAIRTVGNVDVDETRLAYVQTRFPGWIQKVFADATYQYIRRGQPLFTIYSPDLVTTEQEYLLAKKNSQQLAQSTLPEVKAEAQTLLAAATERLRQWQVPDSEIKELETTGKIKHDLVFISPVSGYITQRNALPNMYVQPETKLYTVADLSTVWVNAQVFQTDLGMLRIGDPVEITVDVYPGRTFRGRAQFLYPDVDPTTRTEKVRLEFANPDLRLKPGMFVNVLLLAPRGRQLVIPTTGVLQSGTRQIAFVDHGGGYLEPREIELGQQVGDEYVVLKGLKAGERIVSSANFLVDSESQLQAAIGAFVPPPPGAGQGVEMNTSAPQATVDMTTDPSPPHKGSNRVRAKLTAVGGTPVTGAQVTVTFYMPAMAEMGMAAMRTVVTLTDKGGGNYEGNGDLGSGGQWQVSVLARKGGQTVAMKQLTVNARGGM